MKNKHAMVRSFGRSRTHVARAAAGAAILALFAGATIAVPPPPAQTEVVAIIDGKEVPVPDLRMGDKATVRRILEEGRDRSQVMEHIRHLTKQIGPRLTGSSNAKKANEWCRSMYTLWGLENARLEQWGTIPVGFDRGPSSGKLLLVTVQKNDDGTEKLNVSTLRELQFSTPAWSKGTDGPVRGKVLKEPRDDKEYETIKADAKGAWVMLDPPKAGPGQRGIRGRTGDLLNRIKEARKKAAEGTASADMEVLERLALDGVAGFLTTSREERVWTGAAPGWRTLDPDNIPADLMITIRGTDYDAINSRLFDGDTVELEFDLKHTLVKGPVPTFNTIAEIRGSEFPDEYVIVSAHLDSWDGPGSEGCTDNGTGSSTVLEAARILKAVGARPRRTILFANWTGEEQGLLGSREFVKQHKDLLPRISAVFVDDGGTNYEGGLGVATQMVPMMAAATAPMNNWFYSETDSKFLNVNIKNSGAKIATHGSSDHASFNAVGVPGFFWDETGRADYGFGWHTQNDKLELAIPEYLAQSATCMAVTAYNLACADTLLPRVEQPKKEDEQATN